MSRPYLNDIPLLRISTTISSDEEEEQDRNEPMDQTQYATPKGIELIDLVSPNVSPQGLKQITYIPKTLKSNQQQQQRLSILPLFPSDDQLAGIGSNETLFLLANVPQHQLSIEQRTRRQSKHYRSHFTFNPAIHSQQSFLKQKYKLFFEPIMDKLQVDTCIVDFNYTRLESILRLFADIRHRIFNHPHRSTGNTIQQWQLKEEEYPMLMEFYLQMDVDLFYMKTCSFRQAQPRSTTEGLFCLQLPECRYTMKTCGKNCEICSSSSPSVQFNQYQRHRFINGYETILNCPATCSSTNIIYVLTCPCNQYDFIGESSQTLANCLQRHRQFINLFIHEFLIGERHRKRAQGIQQSHEMASKNRMRLYQHAFRCSSTIRLFLNTNPQYWPFIPMLEEDAKRQDQHYLTRTTTIGDRDPLIELRLTYVPKPPEGYRFSRRQLIKQYHYFSMKLEEKSPNDRLDVYQAKMIALLPSNSSESFRQIIHALFVTHAETKLNIMGHLFDFTETNSEQQRIWCENFHRQANL